MTRHGAGKSYLASKIIKKNLKNKKIKVKIIHLWKFQNRNQNVNTQKPYLKSNYIYLVSLIKEFYIMIQIIILIFKIFSMINKKVLNVSCALIIDLNKILKNLFLKLIYNIFFRNAIILK